MGRVRYLRCGRHISLGQSQPVTSAAEVCSGTCRRGSFVSIASKQAAHLRVCVSTYCFYMMHTAARGERRREGCMRIIEAKYLASHNTGLDIFCLQKKSRFITQMAMLANNNTTRARRCPEVAPENMTNTRNPKEEPRPGSETGHFPPFCSVRPVRPGWWGRLGGTGDGGGWPVGWRPETGKGEPMSGKP